MLLTCNAVIASLLVHRSETGPTLAVRQFATTTRAQWRFFWNRRTVREPRQSAVNPYVSST